MGLMNNIRNSIQAFAESGTIPVGGKIFRIKTTEFTENPSEKYEDILKLLNDERIYSLVALTASLVQDSYQGIFLRAEDRFEDKIITTKERKALKLADEFEDAVNGINLKGLMFDIAFNMALFGEEIYTYEIDKERGVIGLPEVPLNSAFFVDNKTQINSTNVIVRKGNILVVKKNEQNTNPDIIKEEDFEHITYHSRGVWRKDIDGRDAFGVYSIVPGKCLINLHKWKLKTMENDIAWKNKLMPRIKYMLDMAGITAAGYPGKTKEEKTNAALADARKIIQTFKNDTKIDSPDEDLILSKSVEAEILEPKTTSYQDPNGTLEQINSAFGSPFGIPSGQLGGDSAASMGAQLDSFFESIRIETLAGKIAVALTRAVRKQIILTVPALEDEAKRLYVHIDATLPMHKFEIARTLLNLANTGLLLKTEGRNMLKLPRNPQVPDAPLLENANFARSSTAQLIKSQADEKPGGDTNNEGPGANENNANTTRAPGEK